MLHDVGKKKKNPHGQVPGILKFPISMWTQLLRITIPHLQGQSEPLMFLAFSNMKLKELKFNETKV